MGRDVAEEVQRMGRNPQLGWKGFDRVVAETPRVLLFSIVHSLSLSDDGRAPSAPRTRTGDWTHLNDAGMASRFVGPGSTRLHWSGPARSPSSAGGGAPAGRRERVTCRGSPCWRRPVAPRAALGSRTRRPMPS